MATKKESTGEEKKPKKKASVKKAAAKTVAKKTVAKKAVAKKTVAKKTVAKKTVAKKVTPKVALKKVAVKTSAKKAAPKASAKKAAPQASAKEAPKNDFTTDPNENKKKNGFELPFELPNIKNLPDKAWRLIAMVAFAFLGFFAFHAFIILSAIQYVLVFLTDKSNAEVAGFLSSLKAYFLETLDYLSYERDEMPFPFSPFPTEHKE